MEGDGAGRRDVDGVDGVRHGDREADVREALRLVRQAGALGAHEHGDALRPVVRAPLVDGHGRADGRVDFRRPRGRRRRHERADDVAARLGGLYDVGDGPPAREGDGQRVAAGDAYRLPVVGIRAPAVEDDGARPKGRAVAEDGADVVEVVRPLAEDDRRRARRRQRAEELAGRDARELAAAREDAAVEVEAHEAAVVLVGEGVDGHAPGAHGGDEALHRRDAPLADAHALQRHAAVLHEVVHAVLALEDEEVAAAGHIPLLEVLVHGDARVRGVEVQHAVHVFLGLAAAAEAARHDLGDGHVVSSVRVSGVFFFKGVASCDCRRCGCC